MTAPVPLSRPDTWRASVERRVEAINERVWWRSLTYHDDRATRLMKVTGRNRHQVNPIAARCPDVLAFRAVARLLDHVSFHLSNTATEENS